MNRRIKVGLVAALTVLFCLVPQKYVLLVLPYIYKRIFPKPVGRLMKAAKEVQRWLS